MTLLEALKNGTKMVKFYIDNGFRLEYVDKAEAKRRFSLCRKCPHFLNKTAQCGICECFMPFKTKLLNDPVSSESAQQTNKTICPKGYW